MKKLFLFLLIISFVILACLEPEHDNPYDPQNPDKAYLRGITYKHNLTAFPGALIKLIRNDEIIKEVESDNNGWYEIDEIDPGIYAILAEAGYYTPVQIFPESLPADSYDTLDILFSEIFFDFENESAGIIEPHGFNVIWGNWIVISDPAQPGAHSVPNVYNGTTLMSSELAIALFNEPVKDFWFEIKLKILDSSDEDWETGVVLRYQDEHNFYLLLIAADKIALFKIINNNWHLLAENTSINFSKDNWYSLGADFRGGHINVSLNQSSVFDVQDDSFLDGAIGLWLRNLELPNITSVNFDDIAIRALFISN